MSRHHKGLRGQRWKRLRLKVLRRASWRCAKCGGYANQVDHIEPLSRGGDPWDESNLQVLCKRDHAEKTATELPRDPERQAWADYLRDM